MVPLNIKSVLAAYTFATAWVRSTRARVPRSLRTGHSNDDITSMHYTWASARGAA